MLPLLLFRAALQITDLGQFEKTFGAVTFYLQRCQVGRSGWCIFPIRIPWESDTVRQQPTVKVLVFIDYLREMKRKVKVRASDYGSAGWEFESLRARNHSCMVPPDP